MATSAGAVYVDVKANTQPFQQSMNGLGGLASKFGGIITKEFGGIITKALSVAALAKFGAECTQVASELTELQNVVDQVFPTMNARLDEWSQNLISTFGLSEAKAKHYAGTMASMARSMGFTEEQAYAMSTRLAELSGDIASFYDINSDEAFTKLESVFTGMVEPMRSLGINMTQASLDAYAMSHGIEKSCQDMSEAERTLLRYQFVLDRTAYAQGDFARTSDSWANQLRILSMHFEELKATLGGMLIEALLPAIQALNALIERLNAFAVKFASVMGMMAGNGKYVGGITSAIKSMAIQSNAGADATANLAAASAGAAGAAGAQDKAMKKLSRTLAGFDRINKLNADSSSGGGGGGGGGGGLGALDGLMDDLVFDAPKVFGDNMKRELKDALKEGLDKGLYKDLSHALPLALRTTIRNARRQLGIPEVGLVGAAMSRFSSGSGGGGGFTAKTITRSVVEGLNSALKRSNKGAFGSELSILGGEGGVRNLSRGGGGAAFHIDNMEQVRELADAWGSVTSKTAKLTAETTGKDKVDTLKKTYDGIKDKNAKIGFQYNGTESAWKTSWQDRVNKAFYSRTAASGSSTATNGTAPAIGFRFSSDYATWKANWKNRVEYAFYSRTAAAGKSSATNGTAPAIGYRYTNTYDAWKQQWASRVKAFYSLTEYNSANKFNSAPSISYRFTNTEAAWKKQWSTRVSNAFPDKTATVYLQTKLAGVKKATIKNSWTGQDISGLEVAPSAWFAQGGWVARNTPTLAVIGDNTREGEIVSPESKFQTMLDRAAGTGGDAETVRMLGLILQAVQGIDTNVYIDSRDVTRAVVGNINRQVQSTGRSPLYV